MIRWLGVIDYIIFIEMNCDCLMNMFMIGWIIIMKNVGVKYNDIFWFNILGNDVLFIVFCFDIG